MMQVQAELVALKRDLAAATARAEAAESLASASAAEFVLLAEAGSQRERDMGVLRVSGEAAAARVEELEVALMEMEEVRGLGNCGTGGGGGSMMSGLPMTIRNNINTRRPSLLAVAPS